MNERIESMARPARRRGSAAARAIRAARRRRRTDDRRGLPVQAALVAHRLAQGARRIGMKMTTSRAKMQQMGLSGADLGPADERHGLREGGPLSFDAWHPPARRTRGLLPPAQTRSRCGDADAGARRRRGGGAGARGDRLALPRLPLLAGRRDRRQRLVRRRGAQPRGSGRTPTSRTSASCSRSTAARRQVGTTAAIRPRCARWWRRLVAQAGERLEPGSLVMAGGATAAVELRPGATVSAEFQRIGRIGFQVSASGVRGERWRHRRARQGDAARPLPARAAGRRLPLRLRHQLAPAGQHHRRRERRCDGTLRPRHPRADARGDRIPRHPRERRRRVGGRREVTTSSSTWPISAAATRCVRRILRLRRSGAHDGCRSPAAAPASASRSRRWLPARGRQLTQSRPTRISPGQGERPCGTRVANGWPFTWPDWVLLQPSVQGASRAPQGPRGLEVACRSGTAKSRPGLRCSAPARASARSPPSSPPRCW